MMPLDKHAPAPPLVVITRPLVQALVLQEKVLALGRQSVIFPLLEISALIDNTALDAVLSQLQRFALVAFVSPNAIDAAFARCPAWPATVPLAVMGEGSRHALAAHGVTASTTQIYSPIDVERTDSQTLLAALDPASFAGQQVLILRGDGGRELLADALRAAGADVVQVTAYQRKAPTVNSAMMAQLRQLLDEPCEWIITSSEALRVLVQWASQLSLSGEYVAILQQKMLIVPHARIAETAQTLGFNHITRTASGDTGLLAALQSRHE